MEVGRDRAPPARGAERPDLNEIGIPRHAYDAEVTPVESLPCTSTTDIPYVIVTFLPAEGPD